jgi:YD repeat-containing protein
VPTILGLADDPTFGTGNRTSVTDPKGAVTTLAYDTVRRLTQTTAPSPFTSTITRFTYDADGRQISVAQATGNVGSPWLTTTATYFRVAVSQSHHLLHERL